jgi:hypothetical protein
MHITGFPKFALFVEPEVPLESNLTGSKNPGVGSQLQDLGT